MKKKLLIFFPFFVSLYAGENGHSHIAHGTFGRYPFTRDSSGTSWVPDSSPVEGFHIEKKGWEFELFGYQYLVYDHQAGPRGGKKTFDENIFFGMGQKDICDGILGFHALFSLEPATIGNCGYPLLLQTGETCKKKCKTVPLIDRQHPNNLFMEFAFMYSYSFKQDASAFFYFGIPGEPAIGPPIYLFRFSSEYIPEAPITHGLIDGAHVSIGVATLGLIWKNVKFDASVFNGREPSHHRYSIDPPNFDSYCARLTWNPTDNTSFSASYAFYHSPDELHPCENSKQFTLSGIYNKPWHRSNWQTTAVYSYNKNMPGHSLNSFLLESTLEVKLRHMLFGRFEITDQDNLFEKPDKLAGKVFNISKLSGGYIFEFMTGNHLKWGLGALLSGSFLPEPAHDEYKKTFSYMVFLQTRLV